MAVFPNENGTPILCPTHRDRKSALKQTSKSHAKTRRANLLPMTKHPNNRLHHKALGFSGVNGASRKVKVKP